jgi:rhodanese-related sulfurtransferase
VSPRSAAASPHGTLRSLSPAAIKTALDDGGELALIDVREELTFSQNHLLWACSIPLSRFELHFARLVPRRSTRIVLCDDGDGLVERAAEIITRAGYSDVSCLEGGVPAWSEAGFVLFSGVHVPSKAFGEFVEHHSGTPSIGATELNSLMSSDSDIVVLDSRPFDEYFRVSIPTSINVPGAELVLRVRDVAPSPHTMIVVNCAGRTRSIIGAQSLINAGVLNKVVALRNGTMGWHLAGLTCDHGKTARAPDVSSSTLAWAKAKADAVARKSGIHRIDPDTLARWRADEARTLYVFDVRDPAEYEAGHLPGALSAPGGQLVQATDHYVGTLGARIVLCDDKEVRALMTASWLRQIGWKDVFVLSEAGPETGKPDDIVLGAAPATATIDPAQLSALLANEGATVVDLARSPDYRRGHIPGAWFAIRWRLNRALATIQLRGPLVLTSEDGVLAGLAVGEARALATVPVYSLKGGNAAWTAAGLPLSTDAKMADAPVDVWLKPYEQANDREAAMNAYLSWETDLLEQIKRDGTCNFVRSASA